MLVKPNNISEEEVAKAAHMSLRNFRRQIHSEDRTQTRIVLILADNSQTYRTKLHSPNY